MPLTTTLYHLRPLQLSGLENVRTCPLWQEPHLPCPCHLPSTQPSAGHTVERMPESGRGRGLRSEGKAVHALS